MKIPKYQNAPGPIEISNVDTRSDTTRKGYHEGRTSSAQSRSYFPLLDFYNAVEEKSQTSNNPYVIKGSPTILPGMAGPKQIQQSEKLMEYINNFWKNLKKAKLRLQGTGKYQSGILTQPGTSPTTFNGQNIKYIESPNGQSVTHKFYTDQGSEYILTKDGFARRIKSPHSNTNGSDAGLHDWNQGKTYFLNKDANDFAGQFKLIKEKYPNVAVATGKDGKMYFINTDTNKLILTEDVFPKAIECGLMSKGYYSVPYSQEPKIGYSIFEFGTNGSTGKINWYHPGSSVAFIEGMKQGGKMNILEFLKNGSGIHIKKKNRGKFTDYCGGEVTSECIAKGKKSSNPAVRKRATFAANARKWKHKSGGIIKADVGAKLNGWQKLGNFLNSDTGKSIIDGISTGIQYFTTNNQLSKIQNEFNKSMEAKYDFLKNNIDEESINRQAEQNLANLQQMNPDQNFGSIDLQQEQERLRKNARAKIKQQIGYQMNQEQLQFDNQINAIKGNNSGSLLSGLLNIGKTALLNYKQNS